jgi:hypothetical protein
MIQLAGHCQRNSAGLHRPFSTRESGGNARGAKGILRAAAKDVRYSSVSGLGWAKRINAGTEAHR